MKLLDRLLWRRAVGPDPERAVLEEAESAERAAWAKVAEVEARAGESHRLMRAEQDRLKKLRDDLEAELKQLEGRFLDAHRRWIEAGFACGPIDREVEAAHVKAERASAEVQQLRGELAAQGEAGKAVLEEGGA